MVEFGLKLEDNKVAEWGEHYIQYQKLKDIIKKYQSIRKRYEDMAKKRPKDVKSIKEAFEKGMPSPYASRDNLNQVANKDSESKQSLKDAAATSSGNRASIKEATNEQSGLIKSAERSEDSLRPAGGYTYGSDQTLLRTESGNVIARAIDKAATGVTDYFTKSFERQVRDTLKDIEAQADSFDSLILANIKNVNEFYQQKLDELESRVQYLIESVSQSRTNGVLPPATSFDDEDTTGVTAETPIIHRKGSNTTPIGVAKRLSRRFRIGIQGTTTDGQHQYQHHEGVLAQIPLIRSGGHDDDEEDENLDPRAIREIESIQRALTDQYRSVKLLHNYSIMNYTGFVKIVKKYDKKIPERAKRYSKEISADKICDTKLVEALEDKLERLYANWFCDRNVGEARAQMLPKRGDGLEMDWSQLRLGYRMGMSTVLGLWVCWDCIWGMISQGHTTIGGRSAFPVFRACGGLLFLQWLWGTSTWVWSRYRVNYIYLFDFNPQIVDNPLTIFNDAVDNTLVFLSSMLLYYKAGAHDIPGNYPAGVYPFLLILYTAVKLIFPLSSRGPMWKTISRVVTAPTTAPSFFDGYVGDIFTSMVKVFQDIAWTICFVGSGDWLISEDHRRSAKHSWSHTTWYSHVLIPIITLFPLWIRFNQCMRRYADTGDRFPHLANAFKYALSQTVTLFGAFHPLYMRNRRQSSIFQAFWTFTFVTSSLYSFVWDVYMDWGLGRKEHQMLGPRLMYPNKAMYFIIIAIDLVLRFAWVLTLVPPESGASFALPQYLTAVSMGLELFRRTIWGFLRLENEHRSNTAGFRRVDFVPLHFTTGHGHGYQNKMREHRGFAVLVEVVVVTLLVVGACVVSVVAAQHATERAQASMAMTDDEL